MKFFNPLTVQAGPKRPKKKQSSNRCCSGAKQRTSDKDHSDDFDSHKHWQSLASGTEDDSKESSTPITPSVSGILKRIEQLESYREMGATKLKSGKVIKDEIKRLATISYHMLYSDDRKEDLSEFKSIGQEPIEVKSINGKKGAF